MCRQITCGDCKKKTWAGCGMHIDAALSGVAEADRCAMYKTQSGCKNQTASGEAVKPPAPQQ